MQKLFTTLTTFGTPIPRPPRITVMLVFLMACIIASTALDFYILEDTLAFMRSSSDMPAGEAAQKLMRSGHINTIIFKAVVLAVLAMLMALGYAWARWLWLACFLVGGIGSWPWLFIAFSQGTHTLVLTDFISGHNKIPDYEAIRYMPADKSGLPGEECVIGWHVSQTIAKKQNATLARGVLFGVP